MAEGRVERVGLLEPQAEVWGSRATNAGYFGGYGAGKTWLLAWLAIDFTRRYPGANGGFASHTFRSIMRDCKPELRKLLRRLGVPFTEHKTEHWLRPAWMEGDAAIYFSGCDHPDSLKGPNWSWLLLNEPGIISRDSYDVLQSRARVPLFVCAACDAWRGDGGRFVPEDAAPKPLDEYPSTPCDDCGHDGIRVDPNWVRLAGTPEGFNWLHDEWVDESKHPDRDWSDWLRVYADSRVNVFNSASAPARLLESYDEMLAREKVGGQFVNVRQGRIYYAFDRALHVQHGRRIEYDPNRPLYLCWDFNVEPLCTVVFQIHGRHAWVIDQIVAGRDGRTAEVMQEFCRRYGKHSSGVTVHGDATGRRRDTRSRYSGDYEIIREVAKLEGLRRFDVDVPRAQPDPRQRWNVVNAMLRSAKGETRLWVHPERCAALVRDLEQQGFKPGTTTPDAGPERDLGHSADALGYGLIVHFPPTGPTAGVASLA